MSLGLCLLIAALVFLVKRASNAGVARFLKHQTRERQINEVLWLEELKITNPKLYNRVIKVNE